MKARPLFILVLLAFCSCLAWGGDGMKPSEMKTKDSLHAVISGQLAAFRTGDYATAYGFADRDIRLQFPIERFEQMVKMGYPVIAHSVSAKFGLTFDNGDEAVVNVRVTGEGDQSVSYQYMLRKDGDTWRIIGVVLLKEQTTEA